MIHQTVYQTKPTVHQSWKGMVIYRLLLSNLSKFVKSLAIHLLFRSFWTFLLNSCQHLWRNILKGKNSKVFFADQYTLYIRCIFKCMPKNCKSVYGVLLWVFQVFSTGKIFTQNPRALKKYYRRSLYTSEIHLQVHLCTFSQLQICPGLLCTVEIFLQVSVSQSIKVYHAAAM